MTRRDRTAYLAGLFDGEGSVLIQPCGSLSIKLDNTDLPVLEFLVAQFGGPIYRCRPRARRKTCFSWQVYGDVAEAALRKMLPYLIVKRNQADLALKIRNTPPGQRAKMLIQLKALKRVDHGGRFAETQTK